jgi:hypothetical protein
MRTPVVGMHGRHRAFGTPGPIGWNDHGDPCQARQTGSTPGSLGVNDHGTPLPGSSVLLLPERRQEIEALIDQIIERTGSAAHLQIEQRLQACLDAAKNRGSVDGSQDEVGRCAEAYFYARLHALKVQSAVTEGSREKARWRNALQIGGVEDRTVGAFFQTVGGLRSSSGPPGLSYGRIGQALPGRDAGLAARNSTLDWIERGMRDGLRDRSGAPGKLRRYASVT